MYGKHTSRMMVYLDPRPTIGKGSVEAEFYFFLVFGCFFGKGSNFAAARQIDLLLHRQFVKRGRAGLTCNGVTYLPRGPTLPDTGA